MNAPVKEAVPRFIEPEETTLSESFLAEGHVILPVEDISGLRRLRHAAARLALEHLGLYTLPDEDVFLNHIHHHVTVEKLNALRLYVIEGLNALPWLRPLYFGLARQALSALVGNELVMQRRLNLSIQMPDDASSLLPVHADVWDGDSPFEVVAWLPLVDCRRTKSMFLLPPATGARIEAEFGRFQGKSEHDIFAAIEPDLKWLEVPFGHILLFSQNLMHGNAVNHEPETRWSMNCRFKSLFSPYAGKRLGEFFTPITIRPATRLGMTYRFPEGLYE